MNSASPYSTGGGGTVLEHRYGAVLLTYLLSGSVLPELGRASAPTSIEYQTRATATDDFLIVGSDSAGGVVRASVGVRRKPLIQLNNADSVKLIRRFVESMLQHQDAFTNLEWWVCLTTAVSSKHAHEINDLIAIARASVNESHFRDLVAEPGRTNNPTRSRLTQLDAITASLLTANDPITWAVGSRSLTYELLTHLRVRTVHLEGTDESDRAEAITRVSPMTLDGDGERVFTRLEELSATYSLSGATVTEHKLRSDLGSLIADDYLVATSGRRVGREPAIVRHNRTTRAGLIARRRDLRTALGLDDDQVSRSYEDEPAMPTKIGSLPRGSLLAIRGPLGSGKSDLAMRWLLGASSDDLVPGTPVPLWMPADTLSESLESAVARLLSGPDAVDRYPVDLVIDGIDERSGGNLVSEASVFVAAHPTCRILVTTREGESLAQNIVIFDVPRWGLDEAKKLVSRVADVETFRVGLGWTNSLNDAVRRPLFALIAGRQFGSLGSSPAALIATAAKLALDDIDDSLDLETLAVAAVRANNAVDPRAIGLDTRMLLRTRLVELVKGRVRFTLPIFEQWFASQAVLSGKVPVDEYTSTVDGFAQWRYVLAIATTTGTRELVDPIMRALVRSNPGTAAWVIQEGMSSSIDDDAEPGEWHRAGASVLSTMEAWFDGLTPLTTALDPFRLSALASDGAFSRLQLTIATTKDGIGFFWTIRSSENEPRLIEGIPPMQSTPKSWPWIGGSGPAKGENWVWQWTFSRIRAGLNTVLADHHFLAAHTPEDGVVRREYCCWLASEITNRSPLLHKEAPTALISDAIDEHRRAHPTHNVSTITVTGSAPYPREALDDLEKALNRGSGDSFEIDLYPRSDLDAPETNGSLPRYSKEQIATRVARIYEQAGVAYCEIVSALFPKFGTILGHAATFPAVLSGTIHHDPIGMGDFGDTTISYEWTDNIATTGVPPVKCDVQLVDDPKDAWFEAFADREDGVKPDDRGRDAFGLFRNWTSTGLDYSIFGSRPATTLALKWLADDLKSLGWVDFNISRLR